MVNIFLTSEARSTLLAAGWDGSANRSIERDLLDLRYGEFDSPPDYIVSFLKEFSGIEFESLSRSGKNRYFVSFGLDKALEIPKIKLDLAEHSIILGKYLYPIGALDAYAVKVGMPDNLWGREIIAIASDRSIYTSIPYQVSQEGHSINDFINRVVSDSFLSSTSEDMVIRYSEQDPRLKKVQKQEQERQRLKRRAQND